MKDTRAIDKRYLIVILLFILTCHTFASNNTRIILSKIEAICDRANNNLEVAGLASVNLASQIINSKDIMTTELISDLGDKEKSFTYKYLLTEIIGCLHENKAAFQLEKILQDKSENPLLRQRAARTLGILGGESSLDTLLTSLDDPEILVRMGAAKGLGKMKSSKSINKLINKLDPINENKQVNLRICYALGKIKNDKSTKAMIKLIKNEDPAYRYAAVRALGEIGDPNSIEELAFLLKIDKSIRRTQIINAIGKIGGNKGKECLIREVEGGDPLSVATAAEALTTLNALDSIPFLIEAGNKIENKNKYTKNKLQKAIETLKDRKEEKHNE